MAKNLEHGSVETRCVYIKGYASLAAFIAEDRDKSTAIFRRFDRLSARNLLYLQSELAELEAKQDAFDKEDFKAGTEEKASARSWPIFKQRAEENNKREKERMDLVKEIRGKIKEYRQSVHVLILAASADKVAQQGKPSYLRQLSSPLRHLLRER
jgi:hypothetical protein